MATVVETNQEKVNYEEKIFYLFKDLGIPCSILGYKYLKCAVKLCLENDEMMYQVTKRLYPEIARIHNTTGSKVERAIRHAITKAFDYCGSSYEIFGNAYNPDAGKPTNSQYISAICEYVKSKGWV